jgi:hypothetical protein
MADRRYYSVRTGKNPLASTLDLPILSRLFKDLYRQYDAKDYFQEAFGYICVDAGEVPGTLGTDIEFQILRKLRKFSEYSEDDVFDMIEFLYDHVSKPVDGNYHSWGNCGWHYHTFDTHTGRQEYRAEINEFLQDYKEGYELSIEGEILTLPDEGQASLLEQNLPVYDPDNVEKRVTNAILKFRRYRSSIEDRRDALRDLADVLEFLRPKLKLIVAKNDESDLFNIANNFGIRHHNDSQKTDYDKPIWYSWMFYYYLATIHAVVRLIAKQELNSDS